MRFLYLRAQVKVPRYFFDKTISLAYAPYLSCREFGHPNRATEEECQHVPPRSSWAASCTRPIRFPCAAPIAPPSSAGACYGSRATPASTKATGRCGARTPRASGSLRPPSARAGGWCRSTGVRTGERSKSFALRHKHNCWRNRY